MEGKVYYVTPGTYFHVRIIWSEEIKTSTCEEVLENLENILSLEVLGGVPAQDEVIAGVDGVGHNIMHLGLVLMLIQFSCILYQPQNSNFDV